MTSAHNHKLSRREFLRGIGIAASATLLSQCRPREHTLPFQLETTIASPAASATPVGDLVTAPLGRGKGIHPGRVTWVHNPDATRWDGRKGQWWESGNLVQNVVSEMLSHALQTQTGESQAAAAWEALFRHFNAEHSPEAHGYRTGEKIAIKVNLNTVTTPAYHENGSFTSPQIILALLQQLVNYAGVDPSNITVYDATRVVPDCIVETCRIAQLAGVHFVDWSGGNGREAYRRDPQCRVHWSQNLGGNATYLPTCVTEATYLINLASLKGHNLAGVTLCGKNHLGTICADLEDKPTQQAPQGANIHGTIAAHDYGWGDPAWTWVQRPMGTYNALVDLMAHPHLGGKTLLYMLDGFYVSQDQSSPVTGDCRWQSSPFSDEWTASLFLSQDGVAIDSVGLDFLRAEPTIAARDDVLPVHTTCENYLREASSVGAPPSGTRYAPPRQPCDKFL